MSKDFCNFQIEIPCKDCPMAPVCTINPSLKNVMKIRRNTKGISILDGDDSIKTYNVPIPTTNEVTINFYIMCKYRSCQPKKDTYYNFGCSIPCLDCTFSKHCKYGPCYLALPDLKNALNFYFKRYGCGGVTDVGDADTILSYFLSIHCNHKGRLDHGWT